MSDITTWFVQQYGSNVDFLSQQKGSKLQNLVRNKPGVVGKTCYVDQIGSTAAQKHTTRNNDTPLIDVNHQRRMIYMYDWEWATLLDKQDELKILVDPASDYAVNAAYALGRAKDEEILTAASGTAYAGEAGGTSTSLGAAQQLTSASSTLNLYKLRQAKKILDNGNVDSEDRFIVVTGYELFGLLGDSTITSGDFNTVKALVQGEIDTFLGFKFITVGTAVMKSSSAANLVIAAHKNGLCLAIAKDTTHRIDERADKSYATQVYSSMGIGATRLEEARVVEIACSLT